MKGNDLLVALMFFFCYVLLACVCVDLSAFWPLGYKTFFMFNSNEPEISTAYKKQNAEKRYFWLSDSQILYDHKCAIFKFQ